MIGEEGAGRYPDLRGYVAAMGVGGAGSGKGVRHVVLSLHRSWKYEPGDALGVWPPSVRELVFVLALAGSHGTTLVAIDETHKLGGCRYGAGQLSAPTVSGSPR